jgi:hypothetical protein
MFFSRSHLRTAAVVAALLVSESPFARAAQQAQPTPGAEASPAGAAATASTQVVVADQDARETRADLEGVLKRLPPTVGRVMRLDPSVMRNAAYLAPYPALSAFLQAHPEVVQNPAFYLEHVDYEFWNPRQPEDAASRAVNVWNNAMQNLSIMVVVGIIAGGILWIIKTLVGYRRWYRTSKIQTEVHTKILDRFTSNEDLLAYMQTEPGRRFLESAPPPVEGPVKPMAAPLSRILWSLQAGVVLATGGFGLLFVSRRAIPEIAQPLFASGVLVLALGVGFVVSAAASYLLSRHLGLFSTDAQA